jgi:hypothetical protein
MDDLRKNFAAALEEVEREKNSPENKAIREIIAVVRNFYYNKGVATQRVKDIRSIIAKSAENDQ